MKVSILTLGCKVNQYESESIAYKLSQLGHQVVFSIEPADAYVLNTCAVTNEAERKSRGMIAKILKVNPKAPIYVCGCSSQNNIDNFTKFENVKAIIGTSHKDMIVELIKNKNNERYINTEISPNYQDVYTAKGERTRTVIKIQTGCNNFCSYCLIPYIRGRERSRCFESVKKEIDFQSTFSKEIVFTGINLSSYGKDLEPKLSLKDVALYMSKYPNVRFKFSSLEQNIITEDFLNVLKNIPNFAPHFHLSLQSGSDSTLKFMNRKYKSAEFYSKVQLIRKTFENASITTDIIVGFPTETEQHFEESYKFAEKCQFSKMHIFPYSKRSGTVAANMKVVATNIKERVDKLSSLDKKLSSKFIIDSIGKTFSVIIETKKDENYLEGHTENYIKCYIKDNKKIQINDLVKVKLIEQYKDGALAVVI